MFLRRFWRRFQSSHLGLPSPLSPSRWRQEPSELHFNQMLIDLGCVLACFFAYLFASSYLVNGRCECSESLHSYGTWADWKRSGPSRGSKFWPLGPPEFHFGLQTSPIPSTIPSPQIIQNHPKTSKTCGSSPRGRRQGPPLTYPA